MAAPRHVLVVGGDSRLGAALGRLHVATGAMVSATTRRTAAGESIYLDLANLPHDWAPPTDTDVAYVCAGITSVQQCETEPEHTAQTNVHATLELCRRLKSAGVFVVLFSTNLVFDGEQPDVPAHAARKPQCAYGRQKASVEAALSEESIPALVVRLTKVVAPSDALLLSWLGSLSRGEQISAFADTVIAPISLACAVETTMATVEHRGEGVLQLSAATDVSYFAVAQHLARRLGAPEKLVRPTSAHAILGAHRFNPRHTTLAASAFPAAPFSRPDPLAAIDSLFEHSRVVAPL